MNIKKAVTISLLACMALCVYAIEYMIPYPLPVPGAKIGLSNAVTLAAFYIVGRKNAFAVLMLRIIISSLLFGQAAAMIYSFAGGLLCYAVTLVLSYIVKEENIWALGVFGALSHNLGQLMVAVIILGDVRIMYYYLYMIIISVVAGSFTGLCAAFSVKTFKKTNLYKNL